MGIDSVGLESILFAKKYVKNYDNMLMLARQGIHISKNMIDKILEKYNIKKNKNIYRPYSEELFKHLQFNNVDSIDCSAYENATIIHDMNKPIVNSLKNKYDFVLDGGTIEHIFNTPQVCENISDLLKIDGIFLSITCNNNFSGHGIYQFSPEFFLSSFSEKYGMKIIDIFLAQVDTEKETWVSVKSYNGNRNTTSFNNTNPVYIITIAIKISNERESLINNSPQQYSYEQIDWK